MDHYWPQSAKKFMNYMNWNPIIKYLKSSILKNLKNLNIEATNLKIVILGNTLNIRESQNVLLLKTVRMFTVF